MLEPISDESSVLEILEGNTAFYIINNTNSLIMLNFYSSKFEILDELVSDVSDAPTLDELNGNKNLKIY
ncbi:16717_t:CDS:2 [Funneliformis caledonium]|uniref:16717_t:CDS:1 n=1 Tax=Funneliformis caledonium TaxID=1117310 RepID=A0A9N8WMX1_9GLOM|nr:16717_t:CDS:2 [Funneliformis caledonium]